MFEQLAKLHPLDLAYQYELGVSIQHCGEYNEAEARLRTCLDRQKGTFGVLHGDTLKTMCTLADCSRLKGNFDEGAQLYTECLDLWKRLHSDTHEETLNCLNGLANCQSDQGLDCVSSQVDKGICVICNYLWNLT